MVTTLLLTLVLPKADIQSQSALAYPKDPRQNIARVSKSSGDAPVIGKNGAYPKDIVANLAKPATGTPVASQKFKPKGSYPKDPRNNLAWR